ncbi:MAG: hypothetical protein Q8R21_02385 [Burkholderiales bacterium]|nr:hypothetical protein [Burkholderiales bacterium]
MAWIVGYVRSPEGGRRPESGTAVAYIKDFPGFRCAPSGLQAGDGLQASLVTPAAAMRWMSASL